MCNPRCHLALPAPIANHATCPIVTTVQGGRRGAAAGCLGIYFGNFTIFLHKKPPIYNAQVRSGKIVNVTAKEAAEMMQVR